MKNGMAAISITSNMGRYIPAFPEMLTPAMMTHNPSTASPMRQITDFKKSVEHCFIDLMLIYIYRLSIYYYRYLWISTNRWVQPDQQQGLRLPPLSLESALSTRILLVCAFLPDVTQQIHSLRASGVISSHTVRAAGEAVMAFRKSSGNLCTTPVADSSLVILSILSNPQFPRPTVLRARLNVSNHRSS